MARSINESHKALKRLLSVQLQKDWKLIRKTIVKKEQKYFQKYPNYIPEEVSLSQISTLPNKVYEYFVQYINKQVAKKDKDLRDAVGSANLKDFHKKRIKPNAKIRGESKRSYFLEAIAIYCGFENYNHFLEKYHGFVSFLNRLDNLHKSFQEYYQEEKEYLQSHKKSIEEFLDEGDLAKYHEIVHLKQNLRANTNLQDMKVYELLEFLSANKTHFVKLYQAIVKYNDEFEIIEQKELQKLRNRRIGLASVVLFILVTSSFSISKLLTPKQLTQADLDKIKLNILDIDQAPEGHATVVASYDASHLGENLEDLEMYIKGNHPETTRKITQSQDTVTFMYEKAGFSYFSIHNQKYKKDTSFILPLKDWTTNVWSQKSGGGTDFYSKMIPKSQSLKNGTLQFPIERMPEGTEKYFKSQYLYAKTIDVPLRNFSIEVRAKLNKDSLLNATCYESTFKVTDKERTIGSSFQNTGCSSWSTVSFYEQTSPKFNAVTINKDLKGFIRPLEELYNWHTIKYVVKNKVIYYYFNDELVYRYKLKEHPVGKLETISYFAKGLGMIDHVKVWNGKGELVYGEEFD